MAEDMTTSFCLHLFWGDDERGGGCRGTITPFYPLLPTFLSNKARDVSILPPLCLGRATAVSRPCLSKTGEQGLPRSEGRVQSPVSWLVPTFLVLCPLPRDCVEQFSNTEKGFNRPQHRGQLSKDACSSEGSPRKGASSRPSLEDPEGRQARQLAEKDEAGLVQEGGRISPGPSDHAGQGTTCPVFSLSGIWLRSTL